MAPSFHGLLNKLSPEPAKYEVVLSQLCDVVQEDTATGATAALVAIHCRAIAEPPFTSLYADLAADLLRALRRRVPTPALLSQVVRRCEDVHAKELQGATSDISAPRPALKGNMRFVAELYNRCLVPTELCATLLQSLLNADGEPSERAIDAAVTFFQVAGHAFEESAPEAEVTAIMARVEALQKSHSVPRARFAMLDVMELRATKWQSIRRTPSPTTTTPTPMPSPNSVPVSAPEPSLPSPPVAVMPPPPCSPTTPDMPSRRTPPQQRGGRSNTTRRNVDCPAVQRTVYAVGIDSALSERDLVAFLSQCGTLTRARLCGDTTNRCVYGFFEYQTRAGAEALMRRTKTKLGNYTINLSWARTPIRDARSERDTRLRVVDLSAANGMPCAAVRDSPLVDAGWTPQAQRPRQNTTVAHNVACAAPMIPSPQPHTNSGSPCSSYASGGSLSWADDEEEMDFTAPLPTGFAMYGLPAEPFQHHAHRLTACWADVDDEEVRWWCGQ